MPKYLVLLRGINVSGQKLIKMKDLQTLFEVNGFKNVITYIQSGNVIFETPMKNEDEISAKIKKCIKSKFTFEVENMVMQPDYLKSVVKNNPYAKRKDFDEKKLYVSFLKEKPGKDGLESLSAVKSGDDSFVYIDQQIYFYCPGGYGKTKFSNNLVESKLKIIATTRNWNSVVTLLDLFKN